jgi:hypothetical protein
VPTSFDKSSIMDSSLEVFEVESAMDWARVFVKPATTDSSFVDLEFESAID